MVSGSLYEDSAGRNGSGNLLRVNGAVFPDSGDAETERAHPLYILP